MRSPHPALLFQKVAPFGDNQRPDRRESVPRRRLAATQDDLTDERTPVDRRYLLQVALTALAYIALGLLVLDPRNNLGAVARVVWPGSGVALAALILGGTRLWPGVVVGAGLLTAMTSGSAALIAATAIGNGLEAWIAAKVLEKWGFKRTFERRAYVVHFALAAVLGALCSGVFGVASLFFEGLSAASVLVVLGRWSAGHAIGSIVLTPFLLTLPELWALRRRRARLAELTAGLAMLAVLGFATLTAAPLVPLSYLPFPILIWAAVRFGFAGATPANLLLSGIVLQWTGAGQGPFVVGVQPLGSLIAWVYCSITAFTTLFLAALVTEARSAQSERKKSESDYRLLIEQAPEGVIILNSEGRCVDANSSVCQMLGRPIGQILAAEATDLVIDQHQDRVAHELSHLGPGRARVSSWRLQRKDGTSFPAEVSVKRFEDGRIQAFIRDDTRRKSLEEQLMQAQKMDAVGQLAGGVAHEFNNILTLILGHSYALRSRLKSDSAAEERILRLVEAAERGGKLTRRLLIFARREPVEPQIVILNDLVSDLGDILPRLLGEDIQFVTVLSSEPWKVSVDPGLLQQVMLNVALNARDAMPEGGRIVIECRNVHLQGEAAGSLPAGDYGSLAITDTGVGMTSDIRSRIFEPFFTTKRPTEGSGLGLAVSYGIIKQADGDIRVRSAAGEGSTVEIFLPRVRGESNEVKTAVPADTTGASARGETILLVEDEAGVRELALSTLQERGYNVWTAVDGDDAIRLSKTRPSDPIHLIVSDVVLPGISGPEAVRVIRTERNGLPALFISGYPEDKTAQDELRTVGTGFLAKPFAPGDLLAAVEAMLDGGSIRADAEAS